MKFDVSYRLPGKDWIKAARSAGQGVKFAVKLCLETTPGILVPAEFFFSSCRMIYGRPIQEEIGFTTGLADVDEGFVKLILERIVGVSSLTKALAEYRTEQPSDPKLRAAGSVQLDGGEVVEFGIGEGDRFDFKIEAWDQGELKYDFIVACARDWLLYIPGLFWKNEQGFLTYSHPIFFNAAAEELIRRGADLEFELWLMRRLDKGLPVHSYTSYNMKSGTFEHLFELCIMDSPNLRCWRALVGQLAQRSLLWPEPEMDKFGGVYFCEECRFHAGCNLNSAVDRLVSLSESKNENNRKTASACIASMVESIFLHHRPGGPELYGDLRQYLVGRNAWRIFEKHMLPWAPRAG